MMDGGQGSPTALLTPDALGRLMPLFLWVADSGHIRATGPTLAKLTGEGDAPQPEGQRFLELFEVTRPRAVSGMDDFATLVGRRLHMSLRDGARTSFRGLAVPLAPGQGFIVNLSFGIGLGDAVRDHALTDADFAATDLAVELLYLQEAKSGVMGELSGMNQRLEAARASAEQQALTDPLTGLSNRRALELALIKAVDTVRRGGQGFSLVHMDLDFFKAVNDTLGHAAGDHVLVQVARILREETRRPDVVARAGGDEFILLLRGITDVDRLRRMGARIIARLQEPMLFEGQLCRISGSAGVTMSPLYDSPDADRMQSDADLALYASKRLGRSRCTLFEPGMELPDDMRAKT